MMNIKVNNERQNTRYYADYSDLAYRHLRGDYSRICLNGANDD
jgi:hypothetical protein